MDKMDEVTIHLEPAITEEGLEQLRRALAGTEQVRVAVEAADAHQADRVMEILEAAGFDYQPRGSHDGKSYFVIARRKTDETAKKEAGKVRAVMEQAGAVEIIQD